MIDLTRPRTRVEQRIENDLGTQLPSAVRRGASLSSIGLGMLVAIASSLVTIAFCSNRVDWQLVQAIPGTFLAALIVGPITFAGVLLTNGSHDRRSSAQIEADQNKLELQLLHDADKLTQQLQSAADEATIKRETEMRREVYLDAAEQLVNAQMGLATLYAFDLENDPTTPLKGFAVANAKLLVVANSKTIREAMKLASLFNMALLNAIPNAKAARDAIALADYSKRTADEYERQWTGVMNELERIEPNTIEGLQALTNQLKVHERLVKWRDDAKVVYQRRAELASKAKLAYTYFLRPHLEKIATQQIAVLSHLREELELDGDEAEVQQLALEAREGIYRFLDEKGGPQTR